MIFWGIVSMKRFLVVDDDAQCREMLGSALSELASCDTAESGEIGIGMYQKAALAGEPYDLVCTEICMSAGMDGHALVRKIRDFDNSLKPRIFVITSSNSAMDMSQALLNNDCDEYILKPFRTESLKLLLNKYRLIDNE
jgi:two-component system chemotaxis response regulator CheY